MVCEDLTVDLDGATTLNVIKRLIQENYGFILVFVAIFAFLLYIALYFLKDLRKILSDYYGYSKKISIPSIPSLKSTGLLTANPEDNEVYTNEILNKDDIEDGLNKETKDFYKTVDDVYSSYNTLKTEYIQSNYDKKSDPDVINNDIIFSKYDEY